MFTPSFKELYRIFHTELENMSDLPPIIERIRINHDIKFYEAMPIQDFMRYVKYVERYRVKREKVTRTS